MSKGQSIELFEILILVVGSAIFLIISYFFLFQNTSTAALIGGEESFNKVGDSIINFQFAKVAGTEKSLAHILSDGLISKDPMYVSYGKEFGIVNVSQTVTNYFNNYFGSRWQLILPLTKFPYLGKKPPSDAKNIQTFELPLPIPNLQGKVQLLLLRVW